MFESQTGSASVLWDAIRNFCSLLDRVTFGLLEFVYQLFFNVASADLFSNDTIMKFYGRVQLIIGVYMMFLLAITILKGIMNPDSFTGGKDGGTGSKLITRIATALILLTVLVPINLTNPRNEYEEQIRSNGLLFGTLYSLQHRILANNTLGRLILGTDSSSASYFTSEGEESLKQSARIFTSTVLKGFYRINLVDEDDRVNHEDGKDDAIYNDNRVCKDIDDDVLAAYTRVDANPGDIIGMVTMTCTDESSTSNPLKIAWQKIAPKLSGSQKYVFAYTPFISAITAVIFAVILLSFTIDVAVRAVKLAVLRLLAPIPIISYMDPNGGKDSAFNSWVKTLSSTYLDLFIRLAVVYFVLFLIQDMIVEGVVINHGGNSLVGILSLIIIWIGLFMFAKQAPKFIKEVLGIKNDSMGNIFGRAFGMTAAGLGMIGSAATGYRAAKQENDALHEGQTIRNGFRNVGSAIAGAIGGGYAGMKALDGKDASISQVLQAQSQANARRASHSTLGGRLSSSLYGMATGTNLSSKLNEGKKNIEAFTKAQSDWQSALEGEAKKNGAAFKYRFGSQDYNVRYEDLERDVATAKQTGSKVRLRNATTGAMDEFDASAFSTLTMEDVLKKQVADFQSDHYVNGGKSYSTLTSAGQSLYAKHEAVKGTTSKARKAISDAIVGLSQTEQQTINANFQAYNVDDNSTYGAAKGAAGAATAQGQNDMRQVMRAANDQAKKSG